MLVTGWAYWELPLRRDGLGLGDPARRLLQRADQLAGGPWREVLDAVEAGANADEAIAEVAGKVESTTPTLTAQTPAERLAERNKMLEEARQRREREERDRE